MMRSSNRGTVTSAVSASTGAAPRPSNVSFTPPSVAKERSPTGAAGTPELPSFSTDACASAAAALLASDGVKSSTTFSLCVGLCLCAVCARDDIADCGLDSSLDDAPPWCCVGSTDRSVREPKSRLAEGSKSLIAKGGKTKGEGARCDAMRCDWCAVVLTGIVMCASVFFVHLYSSSICACGVARVDEFGRNCLVALCGDGDEAAAAAAAGAGGCMRAVVSQT